MEAAAAAAGLSSSSSSLSAPTLSKLRIDDGGSGPPTVSWPRPPGSVKYRSRMKRTSRFKAPNSHVVAVAASAQKKSSRFRGVTK